ncbi:MAG TPA: carboxypeptidase-like regulatory domain-containing protein, partial [Thermoanaerobaculia bacterium]|nr:carboxypeptidase-like regulatory domain-containing protein [Thermoanaerobaculia bacterium]
MPAAAAITGSVMNIDGAPVAGARVSIFAYETPEAERTRFMSDTPEAVPLATAQTDAKGAFSLESPKQSVVRLQVNASGYVPIGRRVERDEDAGALMMPRADSARTGTVTSGGGKGVANATVVLSYGAAEQIERTNEQGRYNAPDFKRLRKLTVLHPDYALDEKTFSSGAGAASSDRDLNRTLSAGVKVTGRVLGADGETPVANAVISIDGRELAKSGEDGTFTVAHATSRWAMLTARKDTLIAQQAFAKDKVYTLRLAKAATISGRVTDVRSRAALAGVVVSASTRRFGGEPPISVETDAKGQYSLVV